MNALVSTLKGSCLRKALLTNFVGQGSLPLSLPICNQIRLKSKRKSKKDKEKKEKEIYIPRFKKQLPDLLAVPVGEISETPATDDVWIHKYYPMPTFTFLEALNKHREYAAPEMTDNLDSNVMLEAVLDITGKSKTSFLEVPEGILLMPNDFDNFFPGRVVAITKDPEEQANAQQAGAIYSGGVELIKKIEKGDIRNEDYDTVVLSENLLKEAAIIKKVLRDVFPSRKNGTLDFDVVGMVKKFAFGKDYKGSRISESEAKLTLPIGKLNFTNEQLVDNIKVLLNTVKSQNRGGAKYFKKLIISCPPSKEHFVMEDTSVMPAVAVAKGKKGKKDDSFQNILAMEPEQSEKTL